MSTSGFSVHSSLLSILLFLFILPYSPTFLSVSASAATSSTSSVSLSVSSSLLPPPVPTDILSIQRDLPVVSTLPPQYLDTVSGYTWTIRSTVNPSLIFNGTVPGDLITDLQVASIINDPIYENTFLTQNLWNQNNTGWIYSVNFTLDPYLLNPSVSTLLFVMDSIKLVGDIYLNNNYLGYTNNQFLRYTVPLTSSYLTPSNGPNNLTIVIAPSNDPRLTEGRVEGFAAGWDWGPITKLANGKPDDTSSSRGIIRSLYLLGITNNSLALVSVTPRVYYQGTYPLTPLTDNEAGPWLVNTSIVLFNPQISSLTNVTVILSPAWSNTNVTFTIPSLLPGNSTFYFPLSVDIGTVQLWWTTDTTPFSRRNQIQPLYNLTVTIYSSDSSPIQTIRSIGFRVFVQVTADDSNPSGLANQDGSGNLTMRWKVNGANIFSRGADIIPMEWLDGRQTTRAYYRMLQSAIDANFNTLRIDGIDMYFPDYFYTLADQYGILLYHDLQYSQAQPAPAATESQTAELIYQLRRLGNHPSIVLWDACNECGGHGIYASFVMTTLAAEDTSRPIWPSSPSEGWNSGVDTLWGLPNGSPLGLQPRLTPPSSSTSSSSASSSYSDYFTTGIASLTPTTFTQSCTLPDGTSTNCTVQLNMDYCNTCFNSSHPNVDTYEECCAACTAVNDPTVCMVAVFFEKTCWFKPSLNSTVPIADPGRIAVWPSGHGPIPPLPPPGPEPPQTRETHGPYLHGGGFPSVNSPDDTVTVTLPPNLFPSYLIGPNISGTFASEFGCVAMSSFESMSITLDPSHWSFHGGEAPDNCTKGFFATCSGNNPMAQRNYVMDNIINAHFDSNRMNADEVGENAFRRQLYMSLISQALVLSADIQTRRSHNSWGTLIWQLNEIWPTGGWGTIEYGNDFSIFNSTDEYFNNHWGYQIIGGRWKPLHYWLRKFIYTDFITACGVDGRCYIKNDDALQRYDYSMVYSTRTIIRLTDNRIVLNTTSVFTNLNNLGGGLIAWVCLDNQGDPYNNLCNTTSTVLTNVGCQGNGSDCVLLHSVSLYDTDTSNYNLLSGHTQYLAAPNTILNYLAMNNPSTLAFYIGNLNVTIDPQTLADGSIAVYINFVNTTSTNSNIALFVTLSTRIAGRFSDNAFTLITNSTTTIDPSPICRNADTVSSTNYCGVRYSATYGSNDNPTLYFYPWTESPVPDGGIVTNFINTLNIQHLGMYV